MKTLAISAAALSVSATVFVGWFALNSDDLDGQPHQVINLKNPKSMGASPPPSSSDTPSTEAEMALSEKELASHHSQKQRTATSGDGIEITIIKTDDGVIIEGISPIPANLLAATKAKSTSPMKNKLTGLPLGDDDRNAPLTPIQMAEVPARALVEYSGFGLLPKISDGGLQPAQVYARPVRRPSLLEPKGPPRIAILVGHMGISTLTTMEAINKLPGPVTLAFNPYADNLQHWIRKARAIGHEVMLQIPLEPFDYPDNDPGPHTLLTELSPKENHSRLKWSMARFTGYVGLTNRMGGKFIAAQDAFRPVLQELKNRGLIYLDSQTIAHSTTKNMATELKVGYSAAELIIDQEQTTEHINKSLAKLESLAQKQGLAIGIASNLPLTIEHILRWSQTLDKKNITLIPVSAAIHVRQHI